MLENIKLSLRITNNLFNDELLDLISTCKKDMERVGINKDRIIDNDPLIKRTIILFCKAEFGMDNKYYTKYKKAYEELRDSISLAEDYI